MDTINNINIFYEIILFLNIKEFFLFIISTKKMKTLFQKHLNYQIFKYNNNHIIYYELKLFFYNKIVIEYQNENKNLTIKTWCHQDLNIYSSKILLKQILNNFNNDQLNCRCKY